MSFNFDRRTFLKGAGAVGAASLLAACGEKSNNTGNGAAASGAAAPNSTGATPLKEFISFESGNRELESWNMLYSQRAEDANVVTNLWDGLLRALTATARWFPPSLPAGSTMRMPPSGPSTCGTTWTGWIATVR